MDREIAAWLAGLSRTVYDAADISIDDVEVLFRVRDGDLAVVFRGTESLRDWKRNLNAGLDYNGCHKGFAAGWRSVLWEVFERIGQFKDKRLLLAGHSLGGALAGVASLSLDHAGCYTFGAPRIGNAAFAQYLQNHCRFVYRNDIVTRWPYPWRRYVHGGACWVFRDKRWQPGWGWHDAFPKFRGVGDHDVENYVLALDPSAGRLRD